MLLPPTLLKTMLLVPVFATILLDSKGQNSIVVYSGANQRVTKEDIDASAEQIKASDFVVAQFETPQEATLEMFTIAKNNGVTTILNPAPLC